MESNWIIGIQHVWFGISLFLLLLLLICAPPSSGSHHGKGIHKAANRNFHHTILCHRTLRDVLERQSGGGIINFRAVGIILGGFVGGPIVGTASAPSSASTAPLHQYGFLLHPRRTLHHPGHRGRIPLLPSEASLPQSLALVLPLCVHP